MVGILTTFTKISDRFSVCVKIFHFSAAFNFVVTELRFRLKSQKIAHVKI
jgi:hypothetical protein